MAKESKWAHGHQVVCTQWASLKALLVMWAKRVFSANQRWFFLFCFFGNWSLWQLGEPAKLILSSARVILLGQRCKGRFFLLFFQLIWFDRRAAAPDWLVRMKKRALATEGCPHSLCKGASSLLMVCSVPYMLLSSLPRGNWAPFRTTANSSPYWNCSPLSTFRYTSYLVEWPIQNPCFKTMFPLLVFESECLSPGCLCECHCILARPCGRHGIWWVVCSWAHPGNICK